MAAGGGEVSKNGPGHAREMPIETIMLAGSKRYSAACHIASLGKSNCEIVPAARTVSLS